MGWMFDGVGRLTDWLLKPAEGYEPVSADMMDEVIAENLTGYRGDGPVRVGNAAAGQVQHDTYGSIILAAMPMFFDRRLPRPGDASLFHLLERLGHEASRSAFQPDAGIWEYRGIARVHTHSAAMCWAGCNRLGAIAAHLGIADRAAAGGKPRDGTGCTLTCRLPARVPVCAIASSNRRQGEPRRW